MICHVDSRIATTQRPAAWHLLAAFLFVWPYCGSADEINRLGPEEESQGFQLLFDGKSLAGWRNFRSDGIRPQWQVIEGTMALTAKGGRDLITEESFAHFDLRLEYTIAERGNSGVMFQVVEESEERLPWRLAPEYQLYDSFNVKVRGDRCAGALYGLIAAPQDLARKPGEWNQVRILLEPTDQGADRLRFWLNGQETVDVLIDWSPTSRWSQLFEAVKDKDHFAEGFFRAKSGPILLQDHGARTAFRNVRIRRLDQDSHGDPAMPVTDTKGTPGSVPYRLAARPQAVPLGTGGGLKMFYDNRMYPQAVALGESVHIVWRGQEGYPYLATYDLNRRRCGKPIMLLDGFPDLDEIKPSKYRKDHHYAPVIWSDQEEHLHVLFGCHKTPGIHLISKEPRSTQGWVRGPPFSESVSYPQIHRIHDDKTLVYYRESGHLGRWQYRISDDGGRSWPEPPRTVIDLDTQPQDAPHAAYAGSYNTTAVSADGKRLHVAFIWKVEEPVFNRRYDRFLDDHTQRYNLYYLVVDLPSGSAFNIHGREVELPLRKRIADDECLVWDTDERVAAVGPSIGLDDHDRPHFLLPVSDKTPHAGCFYHVSFDNGTWRKTPIAETLHPFNSGYLEIDDQGVLYAFLIAGSGHKIIEEGMDAYGWGERVEQWESDDGGNTWFLRGDLSPTEHQRYQSIQFVSRDMKAAAEDLILFYGWSDRNGPGTAYLWDGRRP